MKTLIILILTLFQLNVIAQEDINEKIRNQILSKTDTVALKSFSSEYENIYRLNREEAIREFLLKGYPIKYTHPDGSGFELQGFIDGRPLYNITYNRIAAQTTSTSKVWGSYGFNLDGAGIYLGLWDEGAVFVGHNSFREGNYGPWHAFFIDSTGSTISKHATHVAGTIIADNDNYSAKGMADKSVLNSMDWNWDLLEMSNAASGLTPAFPTPIMLSNHSYGKAYGWDYADYRGVGTKAWYWMAENHQFEDPTDLNLFKSSPGYRLILNNILFPAATKKKQKT